MASKIQCIKLFNLCKHTRIKYILEHEQNNRSNYVKSILKNGINNYYNTVKYGDPDDFDYFRNEEIYLYKANIHEEIVEYIRSGMNFKEQKELFKN
jgi:hypothetical protein